MGWWVHLELYHWNPDTLSGPGTMPSQSCDPINYGGVATLQVWQPEQWRALTTKRNISLLTDKLLWVTLNTFRLQIYVQICGDIKKFLSVPWGIKKYKRNNKCFNNRSYSLFFLMGIFLKHLWLIPNILQWQDCKILTKLVSSQTLPEAATRGVLLRKVFLNMSIDTHESKIFKP